MVNYDLVPICFLMACWQMQVFIQSTAAGNFSSHFFHFIALPGFLVEPGVIFSFLLQFALLL